MGSKVLTGINNFQSFIFLHLKVNSLYKVSHLLTVLNSSINFYIYLAKQGVSELRNLGLPIRDPEETEMVRCFLAVKGAALESEMCDVCVLSSELKLTFPLLIVNFYHLIIVIAIQPLYNTGSRQKNDIKYDCIVTQLRALVSF